MCPHIYIVILKSTEVLRALTPLKMAKHEVFSIFSQWFARARVWVLGRCRVLGVLWCCHMKVLGKIGNANAHTHTHTPYTHTHKLVKFKILLWSKTKITAAVVFLHTTLYKKERKELSKIMHVWVRTVLCKTSIVTFLSLVVCGFQME